MTTPKYQNLLCQTSETVDSNTRLVVLLKKVVASILIDQSNIHCRVTFLSSYKYEQRARNADIILGFQIFELSSLQFINSFFNFLISKLR